MGRHLQFSREEALEKSMHLFWEKGYNGTSIQNLIDEIGIKPGSFYNTFNDKYSIFLEILNMYGDFVISYSRETLINDRSTVKNINVFFNDMASMPDFKKKGCLIIKTIVELAPKNKEVLGIINNILSELKLCFQKCLKRGQELGEISKDKDIKALSSFFVSATDGLILSGKTEISNREMKSIVKIIVSTLN